MKTEVKKIDQNKREINIEVNGEIVKNKFAAVFNEIAKKASIPGFRPGHAPRELVEKNFRAEAEETVLKELLPDVYQQALEKEGIKPLDLPQISEVKLEADRLSFKATVEVLPTINLKKYKGIRINYNKIEVSQEELDKSLNSLKVQHKLDTLDDNFAKGMGYPNLEALKDALEKQIFIQKDNLQQKRIENEVIEQIMQGLDFSLPSSLVNRQLDNLVKEAKLDLALRGVSKEEIEKEEENITKQLLPRAERQVKVYLVFAEIAKRESIPQDENMLPKVMEFLLKEADWKVS